MANNITLALIPVASYDQISHVDGGFPVCLDKYRSWTRLNFFLKTEIHIIGTISAYINQ